MAFPMQRDKLKHELSDDELLKQLNSEEDAEIIDEEDGDLMSFISSFKISPGIHKVTTSLLYSLYKKWSKEPMTQTAFGRRCSQVVERQNTFYLINQDSIFLNKELAKFKTKKKYYRHKNAGTQLHFQGFLKHYNLSKGPVYIEYDFLYWLYGKYEYTHKVKKAITLRSFSLLCTQYIGEGKIMHGAKFYGVSLDIYNHLSAEWVTKFRELRRESRNESQKIRYQKEKELREAYKKTYEQKADKEISSSGPSSDLKK